MELLDLRGGKSAQSVCVSPCCPSNNSISFTSHAIKLSIPFKKVYFKIINNDYYYLLFVMNFFIENS